MFIKKWQLIFLYIGRIDGHLTIIVLRNGIGAFAKKNCPQNRAFDQFFSNARDLPKGMLAAGIDSHITKPIKYKRAALLNDHNKRQ